MKKRIFSAICASVLALAVLVSCGAKDDSGKPDSSSSTSKEVSLKDVHKAVKKAYGEEYLAEPQPEDMLQQQVGIEKDLYDEAIFEMPMVSTHPDKFIAIKAKNGKADEVEKKLKEYREKLISDTMQYPMNVPMIKSSQVVREGDMVFFVLLGHVPLDVQDTEDEAKISKSAKEQVEIGVNAIKEAMK